jgi:phage tail protein X
MVKPNGKRCNECGAINPHNTKVCKICGARLTRRGKTARVARPVPAPPPGRYRSEYGEDDLLVRGVLSTPLGALAGLVMLALIVGLGVVVASEILARAGADDSTGSKSGANENQVAVVTATDTPSTTPLPTNTRPAPMTFPTVTPRPATATPTPTEGPCIQQAVLGDTVYGLAQRCGHRNFSIVDVIVAENDGLACATCLQEGQEITIPWPTPTPGLPATDGDETSFNSNTNTTTGGGDTVNVAQQAPSVNEFGTPDALATLFVEPTLRPGLQWHTVQENENMIIIAQQYDADAKVLSDVNPEIDFAQCDFSERYGGPNCSVLLVPGQRMRVPAPPPTPTLSLTPSGSLTPTPTLTPTFNAPILIGPENDAEFGRNSLITVRWSALGTLGPNEVYLVTVREVAEDDAATEALSVHEGQTDQLFFVLPDDWQPTGNALVQFDWTVAIATLNASGAVLSVREETPSRTFAWQGR